jgi:3-dehydroquinate synthase
MTPYTGSKVRMELGERGYDVLIGQGLLAQCTSLLGIAAGRMVVVVSNTTVGPLLAPTLILQLERVGAEVLRVDLPDGERYKTLETLNSIFDVMLAKHVDRKALVIALGGGVVGDMAGFAAAVYQRGIDYVQIPTTLLSMVDSSIGGKTAVNHPLGKNMIGAFYQPKLVLADIDSLASLPARELSAGMAEVIKHGAISDLSYFNAVRSDMALLMQSNPLALARAVHGSCVIKAAVVGADEREQGIRAHLNFGHTFGHAIEAALGYGEWLHGEAVAAGMVIAAEVSVRLGLLSRDEAVLLEQTILSAGLPVLPPLLATDRFIELMRTDKKASQGIPKFVLLKQLGVACTANVEESLIREVLDGFQVRVV